ncbi:hypothetical protein SRHO_G00246490 [Serrasalmus rhombeus]
MEVLLVLQGFRGGAAVKSTTNYSHYISSEFSIFPFRRGLLGKIAGIAAVGAENGPVSDPVFMNCQQKSTEARKS